MRPRYYYTKLFGRRLLDPFRRPCDGWRRYLIERLSHLHYRNGGYYSQSGQDRFLDDYVFRGLRNGVFVDIGANDGVNLSNTCFFERERGWTGLCVEPNPTLFHGLSAVRDCRLAECCAATMDGDVQFAHYSDERHVLGRTLVDERTQPDEGAQTISVKAREINALLRENGVARIDYLSIDIEGGELNLFRAIDLKSFKVRVVSLEDNDGARETDSALFNAGYDFLAKIGCDRIYMAR